MKKDFYLSQSGDENPKLGKENQVIRFSLINRMLHDVSLISLSSRAVVSGGGDRGVTALQSSAIVFCSMVFKNFLTPLQS